MALVGGQVLPNKASATSSMVRNLWKRPTAGGKSIVTLDGRRPEESRLDRALLRAVARANHWRKLLGSGAARSAYDLAQHEGCRVSYVQRRLPLAFLAPDLVEAILAGRQPRSCTLADFIADQASTRWTAFRST